MDKRAAFTAVVYVLTSGCAWRHLPETFGVAPVIGPWSAQGFAAAASAFRERTRLRNPRTPLLWTLFQAIASGRDEDEVARLVLELVRKCSRHGDQRIYRAVIAVAAGRGAIPPMVRPVDGGKAAGAADPEQLLAGFTAVGEALTEKKIGRR